MITQVLRRFLARDFLGASNFLAGIPGRLRGLLALAFHRMLAPWGSGGAIKTISVMVEFSCLLIIKCFTVTKVLVFPDGTLRPRARTCYNIIHISLDFEVGRRSLSHSSRPLSRYRPKKYDSKKVEIKSYTQHKKLSKSEHSRRRTVHLKFG